MLDQKFLETNEFYLNIFGPTIFLNLNLECGSSSPACYLPMFEMVQNGSDLFRIWETCLYENWKLTYRFWPTVTSPLSLSAWEKYMAPLSPPPKCYCPSPILSLAFYGTSCRIIHGNHRFVRYKGRCQKHQQGSPSILRQKAGKPWSHPKSLNIV